MKRRVDLGICAAIATSQADIPLPPDMIFIGEVGLGGELRAFHSLKSVLMRRLSLGLSRRLCRNSHLEA